MIDCSSEDRQSDVDTEAAGDTDEHGTMEVVGAATVVDGAKEDGRTDEDVSMEAEQKPTGRLFDGWVGGCVL